MSILPNTSLSIFTVTENAKRPGSPNFHGCFYCRQAIGEKHLVSCVLIKKKVKVRMTVEFEMVEPANWSKDEMDFYWNDSSWCANNVLEILNEQFNTEGSPCLCNAAKFEYLGDASEPYSEER